MLEILKELLEPYPLDQFLQENWTQKAVWVPASTPDKFQTYFSWETFNDLLNFHQFSETDLRFSLDGKVLTQPRREQWGEYFQQGATLILNSLHQRVPELKALAAKIQQALGYPTQINLYCSPPGQQGFDCHYDTHEVLILQVAGYKDWFVFPETVVAPVSEIRTLDQISPQTPPYLQCTLNPGDVLYIPRGHWHYAIATPLSPHLDPFPALHLTIGIDCETPLDWLNWLVKDLQNDPQWRQSLPLILTEDITAVQVSLESYRDRLISLLQNPETIQGYLDHLRHDYTPILPFNFPTQLGYGIFEQGLETRFIPSPFHAVKIQNISEHHHQITIGNKQTTLKNLPTDLIDKLFHPQGFSLLDLATWAPNLDVETEVIPLLTRLVTQGVLLVDT